MQLVPAADPEARATEILARRLFAAAHPDAVADAWDRRPYAGLRQQYLDTAAAALHAFVELSGSTPDQWSLTDEVTEPDLNPELTSVLHLRDQAAESLFKERELVSSALRRVEYSEGAAIERAEQAWAYLRKFKADGDRETLDAATRLPLEVMATEPGTYYSSLSAARLAAMALVFRSEVGTHPNWGQDEYDQVTRPWRTVFGPIHPDDARYPASWQQLRTGN